MPPSAAPKQRPPEDQALIDAAKRTGLLEPFIQTLTVVKHGAPLPHDLDGFFVLCMRTLVQRLLPPHAVQQFRETFPHGQLAYYSSQGIGVVVVNQALRLFVPNSQIMGTSLRGLGARSKGQSSGRLSIDDGPQKLRQWLRTRWGYVAGEGALFEQFQHQPGAGSFDRPSVSGS
jgi:hypothetical protein